MKKQRSASPSQAIPRSAPLSRTRSMISAPVLRQQRVGLVVGELAVGLEVHLLEVEAEPAQVGPTIGPAMPLPPSTTTFIGLTFAGSMKESVWARYSSQTSTSSKRPAAGRVAEPGLDLAPHVADPGVARERQRPLADQLHPGVGLGVVGGGDHRAAVELARADQVIEHLGGDHAGVEDGGALEDQPVAQLRRHRGRGQPHVAPQPDPQLAGLLAAQPRQHPREGPPDRVRRRLVHLLAVQPADVIGLEDLRRRQNLLLAHSKPPFRCALSLYIGAKEHRSVVRSLKMPPSAPRSSAPAFAASPWCRRSPA